MSGASNDAGPADSARNTEDDGCWGAAGPPEVSPDRPVVLVAAVALAFHAAVPVVALLFVARIVLGAGVAGFSV